MNKISWIDDDFAPFLSKVQSHHVFDFCLEHIACAEETIISSFAINEAFVKRLIKHRKRLGKISVIWDSTLATRNIKTLLLLDKHVNTINLIGNHSKMISMRSDHQHVVAVSSVNTTGNYRYEGGLITSQATLTNYYHTQLLDIINNSKQWTKY